MNLLSEKQAMGFSTRNHGRPILELTACWHWYIYQYISGIVSNKLENIYYLWIQYP